MTYEAFRRRATAASLPTLALTAATLAGCGHDDGCPPWTVGTVRGGLTLSYTGYGTAHACNRSGAWTWQLTPATPTGPSRTHAALARGPAPAGDLVIQVRLRTPRQLRRTAPQPWEAGWLIWRYTDDRHFYYVILKPNGLEVGKEDPAYPGNQRFLITRPEPSYDIADWHHVEVRQTAATIAVTIDGATRAVTRDQERPYQHGDVGLYTEDAAAHFTDLRVTTPQTR